MASGNSVDNRIVGAPPPPPSSVFLSSLSEVLKKRELRAVGGDESEKIVESEKTVESENNEIFVGQDDVMDSEKKDDDLRPTVLVTNDDGIGSPGLRCLVEALVNGGRCNVNVCAPDEDKSGISHPVTTRETIVISSVDIRGATAYEASGTPSDCVSLGLSGVLFSGAKPAMVISGINKGSTCGHHVIYSGTVAGAREALLHGVPSIAISLNWKKDESCDSHFKEAAEISLPLIHAALGDIEKHVYPRNCLLNIAIPTCPSANKGIKLTRQSMSRISARWQTVTPQRHIPGQFMSREQSLGIQLAQLGRAASAAGAARRLTSGKRNVEIESVAADKPGKRELQNGAIKKYFRIEFSNHECGEKGDDLDFGALEEGFVTITPLGLSSNVDVETRTSAASWLATVFSPESSEGL